VLGIHVFGRWVVATTVMISGLLAVAGPAEAAVRPNILLIVTDEQRPAGLAVMPLTMRWMMQSGRHYADAYVTTPIGNPSRSSLMTGRYAHNHGVQIDGGSGVLDQASTIQAYLHGAGYETALYGKFLDAWADPRSGFAGFQFLDRFAVFTSWIAYYDARWSVQGTFERIPEYSTSYIGDRAVHFLARREAHDAQPWFMMLATSAAQVPPVTTPRFHNAPVPRFGLNLARTELNRSDKPPYVRASPINLRRDRRIRRLQLRAFMPVDTMVSRVFKALRERHEARRTVVVFTSDNGYQWGEHGLSRKGTPYPASFHVPLLIRWPGHFARSGRKLSRPAANVDVAPTLLDAAGVTPDPAIPMDGHSLLRPWTRHQLLLEFWRGAGSAAPPWVSIRTSRYQYTEYYNPDGTVGFREYYTANDPYQLRNLLHDGVPGNNPNVPALHERLASARACAGATCP
jgi:arylsulfatase A-like enzyme